MTTSPHPTRAKDPTLRQIERRAAAIRAKWTADERERRRVERVEPIVLTPIDLQLIGLPAKRDGCPI
jgi:hypothetical protein